jgi:hypothetical protein
VPRFVQEAFNQRIWKAGQAVALLNANIPDFVKGYDRMSVIYATIGTSPEVPGSQRVLSVVFIQD